MPNITPDTICRILNDITPAASGLLRVGLVGSYARNDYTSSSDVDLIFSMEKEHVDNILFSIGARLRSILMNQFRVSLDVINYDSILKQLEEPQHLLCYQYEGYQQMLKDLIWIWEGKL